LAPQKGSQRAAAARRSSSTSGGTSASLPSSVDDHSERFTRSKVSAMASPRMLEGRAGDVDRDYGTVELSALAERFP
jgi:hypothetical protein